jgi:hypothetical protein
MIPDLELVEYETGIDIDYFYYGYISSDGSLVIEGQIATD